MSFFVEDKNPVTCVVNDMAVNNLVIQGAVASQATVLTYFSRNNRVSAPEGLNLVFQINQRMASLLPNQRVAESPRNAVKIREEWLIYKKS